MSSTKRVVIGASSAAGGALLIVVLGVLTAPKAPPAEPAPAPAAPPVAEAPAPAAAVPATPAAAPAPVPVDVEDDLGAAERLTVAEDWAGARQAYEKILAKLQAAGLKDDPRALYAKQAADLSRALREASELAGRDLYVDAQQALEAAGVTANGVVDPERRAAWVSRTTGLHARWAKGAALQRAFAGLQQAWPPQAPLPMDAAKQHVAVLLEEPASPITARAREFLAGRVSETLANADRMVPLGRADDARRFYTILSFLPKDPAWTKRIDEGLAALGPAPAASTAGPLPAAGGPAPGVPRIDVPFPISDFCLTDDGRLAALLSFTSSDVVFVELKEGKEIGRISVPPKPASIASLGGTLWVACSGATELLGIDPTTVKVVRRLPLVSKGPIAVAACPLASPPRLWVRSSDHLHEFDAAAFTLKSSIRLRHLEETALGTALAPHPHGDGVLVVDDMRNGTFYRPPMAEPVHSFGNSESGWLFDGQGQYVMGGMGLFDASGKVVVSTQERYNRVLAAHPQLPHVVSYAPGVRGGFGVFDLNAHAALEIPPERLHADMFAGVGAPAMYRPKMLLRPKEPGIVLAHVEPRCQVTTPSTRLFLPAFPLPDLKTYPGYLAFTSTPPAEVSPGIRWVHEVTVSEPFARRARVEASGLPRGMQWDGASRRLTWEPAAEDIGVVKFTLSAEDPPTGLKIRKEVAMKVDLRKVPHVAWVKTDGRYAVYGIRNNPAAGVMDLQEDRHSQIDIVGQIKEAALSGGRLFYLRADVERIHSVRLPDGGDPQEHDVGRGAPMAMRADAKGFVYAVCKAGLEGYHCVKVGPRSPPVVMLTRDELFTCLPAPDGVHAFTIQGASVEYWTNSAGKWSNPRKIDSLLVRAEEAARFSSDGRHAAFDGSVYAVSPFKEVARCDGNIGLDPDGPFLATMEGNTVAVYRIGQKDRLNRIVLPEVGGRVVMASTGLPIPISKRGIILLTSRYGDFYILPMRF